MFENLKKFTFKYITYTFITSLFESSQRWSKILTIHKRFQIPAFQEYKLYVLMIKIQMNFLREYLS